jgi:hypothetical protein
MNKRELEDAIRDEVAEWPGVSVEFESGGSHPKAKLMFGDLILRRPYPGTPGDAYNGLHKTLGDMRRVMKQLGAERAQPEPSKEDVEKRYSKPNPGREMRPDPVLHEQPKPKSDVVDQLVEQGAATVGQGDAARAEIQAKGSAATYQRRAMVDHLDDDDEGEAENQAAEDDAAKAAIKAQADAIVDGVYFGLPAEVYHKVSRLSTSALQKIDVSPADFWKDSWLDPNPTVLTAEEEKKKSAARVTGAAYHTARLEPQLFEALYARELNSKDYPRAGMVKTDTAVKAALKDLGEQQSYTGETALERAQRLADAGYQGTIWAIELAAWRETLNGRIPLSAKVYDEILIDMTRIHSSGSIGEKLSGGAAEVSVFWTDRHGLKMKARIDYLKAVLWADFKTFANPRRRPVKQVIADAFRYDRYHMQAVVYRDAVEQIRVHGLQIVGHATDEERALIAAIQMRPGELECHYIFQQKGGVPNLLSRQIEFFDIPYNTRANHAGASAERIAAVEETARKRTQLHIRADTDVERCKREFALYAQVYPPGEPWRPIEPEGTFGDADFNQYWLEGKA